MDTNSYAAVLTGDVLAGFAPESVWPALAAYFRMAPDKLSEQFVARAPLTIKHSDDLGKLQTLQAAAAASGAETEICAPDGRPALFVLLDGAARGPVPRVFVEERVRRGVWADGVAVAEVGSNRWQPFREFDAPEATAAALPPLADTTSGFDTPATIAVVVQPSQAGVQAALDRHGEDTSLPPGAAIHAGFWRRCAAYVIDYVVTSLITYAIALIAGASMGFTLGRAPQLESDGSASGLWAAQSIAAIAGFIVAWLYFTVQESSVAQATLGKRVLGLKATDVYGRRIGFGRANARFFGKILSSLVLLIGFMLAGWTARKRALHDMLAGTLVVFRNVQPDQPLPTERAPMPWYGWLINILFVVAIAFAVVSFFVFAAWFGAGVGDQGGTGF